MPLTRQEKEAIVRELSEDLRQAKSVVFTDFTGLNVAKIGELKKNLKQAKIKYLVAKKTLTDLALKSAGLENISVSRFQGPIALAASFEDEVAAAKIIKQFSRTNEALKIIGGVLEKKLLTPAEVASLASLPSKPELLARTFSTINAPLSNFVGVLRGNVQKLVYILSAIKK